MIYFLNVFPLIERTHTHTVETGRKTKKRNTWSLQPKKATERPFCPSAVERVKVVFRARTWEASRKLQHSHFHRCDPLNARAAIGSMSRHTGPTDPQNAANGGKNVEHLLSLAFTISVAREKNPFSARESKDHFSDNSVTPTLWCEKCHHFHFRTLSLSQLPGS